MKNKKLFIILILLLPITLLVGFSTWIIVNDVLLSPQENKSSTFYIELNDQSVEFNGMAQLPSSTNLDLTDENITYKYREVGTSTLNYFDGAPSDAGEYYIYFETKDNSIEASDVKFTITRKKVLVNTIEVNYSDAYNGTNDYRKWEEFYDLISPKISFTDINGNVIPSSIAISYYLGDEMTNGSTQGTYNNDNLSSKVIGSTYTINLEFYGANVGNIEYCNKIDYEKNNNASFCLNDIDAILKYKTACVGETYYTIEDALTDGTTSTITLKGDATTDSSYVETSFTSLDNIYGTNEFALSGRKLLIPYEDSTNEYVCGSGTTTNVYASLFIPNDIILNVSNSGVLAIGAQITSSVPNLTKAQNHGVVMNDGTINVDNGCKIRSYGYLKGAGLVNLNNGANALDVMRIYDWPGGSAASSMYSSVFPTNAWSMTNISCETKINYGATYDGFIYLTVSSFEFEETVNILGNASSSNCLFKPTSSSSFITKKARPANSWTTSSPYYNDFNTIVGSNQIAGQKSIIELNGNYVDSTLKISMTALLVITINMTTSTSLPCPLSYTDIIIKKNASISLSNSDYMFLPGSKLTVEEGAIVTIGKNVDISFVDYENLDSILSGISVNDSRKFTSFCVDKVDAQMLVYGSIVSSGSLGGLIVPKSINATMDLSSSSLKSNYVTLVSTESGKYYTTGSENGKGPVMSSSGTPIKNLGVGKYKSNGSSWYTDQVTIYYDAQGGTLTGNSSEGPYDTGNTGYTFNKINTTNPTKDFYTFNGWYADPNCTQLIYYADSSGNIISSNSYNTYVNMFVYAGWTPNTYNVSYEYRYIEDFSNDSNHTIDNSMNTSTYNMDANIPLSTPASSAGYVFGGWYSDDSLENNIISINGSLYGDDITIYGLWYPANAKTYTIRYMLDDIELAEDVVVSTIIESGKYEFINPFEDDYDNNPSSETYFEGWYTTNTFDEGTLISSANQINNNLTLYAKFADKIQITLYIGDSSTSEYYIPGNVKLPENKENDEILVFFTNNAKNSTTHYIGGMTYDTILSDITLYSEYYYFVKATDYSSGVYSPSLEHANIYLKDLDLSNIKIEGSTDVKCVGSLFSPKHELSSTKISGFGSKGIEKIIINNCSLAKGECYTDNCESHLQGKYKNYSRIYVGLFDSNPLKQVITINQTSSTTLNNYYYLFSNCENTSFNASCIYSDVTFDASNNHFANDSGLVTNTAPSEPSGTYTPVVN